MSKLISGSAGTVLNVPTGAPVPHVTKWMFEPSVTVNKWNSNTSGGTKDANCGPADRILVSGIVVSAPIEVDIDNGTPVSIAYELEGRGAWTGEGRFANV